MARDDEHELVAVVGVALGVHHRDAVAIAIERDAEVGAVLGDRALQRRGLRGAHAVVDIQAVGLDADRHDLGAELVEHVRHDVVCGAMRPIHDDLQALEVELVGERGLAELDVAPAGVLAAAHLAELG